MDRYLSKKRRCNGAVKEENRDYQDTNDLKDDGINEGPKKKRKTEESEVENKTAHHTGHIPSPSWPSELLWKKLRGDNLNVDYCSSFLKPKEANSLIRRLEEEILWNTGRTAEVQIFGKWHKIPRKQAAYGDAGLAYTFSGNTVPAKPWIPLLTEIKNKITAATGQSFNFVLINRYKDGNDHMGEHRDDEKDLVRESPIASLSLGQPRDFIFKHADARGKKATKKIDPVKIELQHGSLLMMNYPTNIYWYHALPVRKKVKGVRINLTFRDFVLK